MEESQKSTICVESVVRKAWLHCSSGICSDRVCDLETGVRVVRFRARGEKAMGKVKLLRKQWCSCVGKINTQDRFTAHLSSEISKSHFSMPQFWPLAHFLGEWTPTPSPVAIQLRASLTSLSCSLGIATLLQRALCGCLCGGETEDRCGSFPGWDSLSVTHWVSLLWVCVSTLSLSDVLCLPGVAPRTPC